MEVTFSISQRGRELLVLNNFKFYESHRRRKNNVLTWRCVKRQCSVSLHTNGLSTDFINFEKYSEELHNHPPEEEKKINRQKISNTLKQKLTTTKGDEITPPYKLILKEIKEYNEDGQLNSVDFDLIRRNLYNTKRKRLGESSEQSLEEPEIQCKFEVGEEGVMIEGRIKDEVDEIEKEKSPKPKDDQGTKS